jgi:drug/metabolite transporter (DMT)-like permease
MRGNGAVRIFLAATLWGIAGGIGGVLINAGWDPIVISFYRGFLTLGFTLVWLAASGNFRGFDDARLWGWSFLAGAGVAGAFSFYFTGMQQSGVAVAATLLYSAPMFVFMTELLMGSERLNFGKVAALVTVFLGVALLTGLAGESHSAVSVTGVFTGLMAGLSYAAFIFGFRCASQRGSIQSVMCIAFTVECVFLAIITGGTIWPESLSASDSIHILLLGMLGGGPSFLLYIQGVLRTPATLASLTAMAEPVTAALFGFVVLGQILSWSQLLGATFIIMAVTRMNIRRTRRLSNGDAKPLHPPPLR